MEKDSGLYNLNKGYAPQEKKDLMNDNPIAKDASGGRGGSWMSKHSQSKIGGGSPLKDEGHGGAEFSEKLFALEILNWQGPIVSEYGAHLVYLESIERSYIPEIAGIYKKLVDNYMQEQLVIFKDRNYQEMRSRYRIILEN